jgi:hypothetical protein
MLQDAWMTLMLYVRFKSSWISNIRSSVTFENRTHVHMTFLTGNDLKNKNLKYWHVGQFLQYINAGTYIYRTLKNICHSVRFEVFTAVRMMILLFWVLVPCRLVGRCQRFSETYLRNVDIYRRVYMAPKPRTSSYVILLTAHWFCICEHISWNITCMCELYIYSASHVWNRLALKEQCCAVVRLPTVQMQPGV